MLTTKDVLNNVMEGITAGCLYRVVRAAQAHFTQHDSQDSKQAWRHNDVSDLGGATYVRMKAVRTHCRRSETSAVGRSRNTKGHTPTKRVSRRRGRGRTRHG